jgi:hypothetical protein
MRIIKMKASIANIAKLSLLATFTIGLLGACANTAELERLANEAMDKANAASQEANAASRAADDAKSVALQANRKADQALDAANDAQACCAANRDRIDRIFEKSMQK